MQAGNLRGYRAGIGSTASHSMVGEIRTTFLARLCCRPSMSNGWNQVICNQVGNSLNPSADEEKRDEAWIAAMQALHGIAPKDELEGMLAAQLIASHSASMECYRRAMNCEQTLRGAAGKS